MNRNMQLIFKSLDFTATIHVLDHPASIRICTQGLCKELLFQMSVRTYTMFGDSLSTCLLSIDKHRLKDCILEVELNEIIYCF